MMLRTMIISLLVVVFYSDPSQCFDAFVYESDFCPEPTALGSASVWKYWYHHLTESSCEALCSEIHGESCISFLYDRKEKWCMMTSFSLELAAKRGEAPDSDCTTPTSQEFYSRHRCTDGGKWQERIYEFFKGV